jgi:bacillithiol synthase
MYGLQKLENLTFMQNPSNPKEKHSWFEVDAMKAQFHNPVVSKYLEGKSFPTELINDSPTKDILKEVTNHADYASEWRGILANRLAHQYQQIINPPDKSSLVSLNIEKLRKPNTVTVTTGQQIHIFLGPLFVVHKIMSCIAHAKKIESENPDYNVIPVFWMATEDHDFEEISSTILYNQTYTWDKPNGGAVGRLNPKTILPLLEDLKSRIDQTEENKKFLNICEHAYSEHETFSLATRYIINELFGHTGLVVIDPDDSVLKNKIRDDIKVDLFDNSNSPYISKQIVEMKKAGIKAPINTRPINYFYLTQNERLRIISDGVGGFSFAGENQNIGRDEMNNLIEKSPEKFSPNALLRPLYQQRILPNISYVSGGSEFIYWLELKGLFEAVGSYFPKLVLRKSVFFVGAGMSKKFNESGILPEDIFLSQNAFDELLSNRNNTSGKVIVEEVDLLKAQFQLLQKLESRITNFILSKNYLKAQNNILAELSISLDNWHEANVNSDNAILRLRTFKNKIFSTNFVQERNEHVVNHIQKCLQIAKDINFDQQNYHNPNTILLSWAS